jgi:8-oxo-dGTP pyrophosphatase MutT (NUDIX family)
MRRKYTIHIEGRPVVIAASAEPVPPDANWLVLRVNDLREVRPAVKQFAQRIELAGMLLHADDPGPVWKEFKGGYRFVQAAGGAVTDEHGRLLAIHRLGRWDLPKGKVDKGEAIPAAAVREVREECGLRKVDLQAPLCDTWHTYERNGEQHLKRTDWFLMRASSHEELVAQAEEDIGDVRWLDAAGVKALKADTYPSLLSVVEAWEAAVHPRT